MQDDKLGGGGARGAPAVPVSASDPEEWKGLVVSVPAYRGRIHFGVAPNPPARTWVVWFSMCGSDVEVLSGWRRSEQADAAVSRYVVALNKGSRRLQEEVDHDPRLEGYAVPGELPLELRAVLRAVVAKRDGQPRG